jgi:hypothetical protein
MADEVNDVILHVWKLPVGSSLESRAAPNSNSNSSSWGGFLDRFLPNVGLGAYHTCLEYDHAFYTFAANVGVVKSSSNRQSGLPTTTGTNAPTYEGTIPLGSSSVTTRAQAQHIVQYLQTHYFHANAYHLVHRNCNHFTETLATALIQREKWMLLAASSKDNDDNTWNSKYKLKTYPAHVNRLANTGGNLIGHDDDIVKCQVVTEARLAVLGGGGAPSSSSQSSNSNKSSKTTLLLGKKNSSRSSSNKKKELTEKQKAILAKIKGGSST